MEEPLNGYSAEKSLTTDFDELKRLVGYNSDVDMSPVKTSNPKSVENINVDSDEDHAPVQNARKRIQRFMDSDSDIEEEIGQPVPINTHAKENGDSDSECSSVIHNHKSNSSKSRIQLNNSDSDSPDDSKVNKNEEQQIRMRNKRFKMKQKFKSLLSSRDKQAEPVKSNKSSSNDDTEHSDSEISSIKTIKQKMKESMSMIPSICDPDTSDEESGKINKYVNKSRPMNERKSTKPTSPKPMRMSAKQAKENMHKIKSESNRMLREKEVSLPYHRPKALSLKDIMNRRRPAVSSDGKALPIKMNEEQLKQYAQLLEQRQKEMMELCKSDTEDEEAAVVEESLPEIEKNTSKNAEINIETNKICEHSEKKSVDDTDDLTAEKVTIVDEQASQNVLNVIPVESSNIHEANLADNDKEMHPNDINVNDESPREQDSPNTDIQLVYEESTEEANTANMASTESVVINHEDVPEKTISTENHLEKISTVNTESESQLIDLQYDTELSEKCTEEIEPTEEINISKNSEKLHLDKIEVIADNEQENFLSDDDINMDDIDKIIENVELTENKNPNSPMLIKEPVSLNIKPKLTGAPGMVIDLDGSDPIAAKKLSGVELLKERFTYFARLKTPEELEREKEKKVKPGTQHLKLKQELEEKIAEQRSLEWAKRLEVEKQQHMEMNAIRGDESDVEDDIDKIEAKLNENSEKESSSESEDLIEDDVEMKDKPRKHNPMLNDEAEESECEENVAIDQNQTDLDEGIDGGHEGIEERDEDDSDESSDESSESEEEEQSSRPKKGRILKAFEDSDGESIADKVGVEIPVREKEDKIASLSSQTTSQDDELQLAQRPKSVSDDIFSSQDALSSIATNESKIDDTNDNDIEIATQTFSILDSKPSDAELKTPDEIDALSATQPYHDPNLDALASGLSLNILNSQLPTQASQSQAIGEDILALCTGKFYDNEFVSQADGNQYVPDSQESCTDDFVDDKLDEINKVTDMLDHIDSSIKDVGNNTKATEIEDPTNNKESSDGNLLKSILDELDDPEFDAPKPNKFFTGANQKKDAKILENSQLRKKFVIDSDDEADATEKPKKKKLKKKKLETRALQISDDEEEEQSEQDEEEYNDIMSDIEDDSEKMVEYDSEENEIEVKPQNPKKKRKATDFFENEAELTSEDEWVGSGDEDEAGLDRMEREEGDDEVFHQGKLRKELGQIHMRDVLDQDKREVRLLQELLFEDGDLGDGHRQRKFRWRNADGDEEVGTTVDEFGNTQEEEFESEEQWRKQRHERAMYLRQMQNQEEDDANVSINRTTIIKANLSSKTMSSLLLEVNQSKTGITESPVVPEKKTTKDIPSPKKSFAVFKQNYHGSLLTRGQGALARLAALATPLATDDDAPKIGSLAPSSKRNFVFTALTADEKPKVTMKRKADSNIGTPKLIKKMKTEDKQNKYKSSLLDHLKAL